MGTKWPTGFSWTKTHYEEKDRSNGVIESVRVQGGPFLWLKIETYLGLRPTAGGAIGVDNEGDLGTGFIGRWLKKVGWGNLGFALRRHKCLTACKFSHQGLCWRSGKGEKID